MPAETRDDVTFTDSGPADADRSIAGATEAAVVLTGDGPADADPSTAGRSVLRQVRSLFGVLAWLLVAVEVVEWLDADSALWPHRSVAAVGLVVAAGWIVALQRRLAPLLVLDVVAAVTVVVVGWGLDRHGSVLALVLGTTLLRSLWGDRRAVTRATAVMIVAYAMLGVLLDGPESMLDLGLLTVSFALVAFVAVIRLMAEVLARHDVAVVWDGVLTGAGRRLLQTHSPAGVERVARQAVAAMRARGPAVAGGLVSLPVVPDVDPDRGVPVVEGGDPAVREGLEERLDRLVTDLRLRQEVLASEDRFRHLADRSRDGIYLRAVDELFRLHYVNPAAAAMFGRAADPDGVTPVDASVIHRADRAAVVAAYEAGHALAEPLRVRLAAPGPDGGERWVEIDEVPSDVVVDGVVTVQGRLRDITATQRQEAALRDALAHEEAAVDRLEEVDELRATFLSAVSHELRTPLAGLLGAAQTLAAHRERLTERQVEDLVAAVLRQGTRLHGLLDDLLDLQRFDRGLLEPEREPTELLALATTAVERLELGDEPVTVAGEEVLLDVDRSMVERIVDNLVRNAVKHTRERTPVRVLVGPDPDGARLVVEDDGDGVPSELREELFSPFVQGPGSGGRPSPGTGIGLSLVDRFARLHDGRVWIEESASGGARFVVVLRGEQGARGGPDATAGRPSA